MHLIKALKIGMTKVRGGFLRVSFQLKIEQKQCLKEGDLGLV